MEALEEELREATSIGNIDKIKDLIEKLGVEINSQHKINGWTALHWACRRGHTSIAAYLIQHGANMNLKNFQGQTPLQVSRGEDVIKMLGGDGTVSPMKEDFPIVPHYLEQPQFPYYRFNSSRHSGKIQSSVFDGMMKDENKEGTANSEMKSLHDEVQETSILLLKVRVSPSCEEDFVEFELKERSFSALMHECCTELSQNPDNVLKIRKLPNVLVRKDKDVQRLLNGQELELVLKP